VKTFLARAADAGLQIAMDRGVGTIDPRAGEFFSQRRFDQPARAEDRLGRRAVITRRGAKLG
jgi:hypothetical protein